MSVNKLRNIRGSVPLEMSLTLPILLTLIFFIIENTIINNIQSSLENIAMECSFDFIGSKTMNNFKSIGERYFPHKTITYTLTVYSNLDAMISSTGGKSYTVTYPKGTSPTVSVSTGNAFKLEVSYAYNFYTGSIRKIFTRSKDISIKAYGMGVCN